MLEQNPAALCVQIYKIRNDAGPMFNDMADLLGLLIPAPFAHFLMASSALLSPTVRASSVPDVMHRLLLGRNLMASPPDAAALSKQPPKLLGALDILQV